MRQDITLRIFPEIGAGGFTRRDGTLQFYNRVHALMPATGVIVEYGAGRGRGAENPLPYFRRLFDLRADDRRVIGIDIDPAVRTNPLLDEAHVFDGRRSPLEDGCADMIVSDYVIEHVDEPAAFAAEIDRLLKPGGWFCARTVNALSLVALVATLIPNDLHARILSRAQTGRKAEDVFPTRYRMNTLRAVRKHFPASRWSNHSYTWTTQPDYTFGNPLLYLAFLVSGRLKRPIFGGESIMIFVQKTPTAR